MKNNKESYISLGIFLLGVFFLSSLFYLEKQPNDISNSKVDCSSLGVFFLKPSQEYMSNKLLAKYPNNLVVIPETNKIYGNTGVLDCGYNPWDYIQN